MCSEYGVAAATATTAGLQWACHARGSSRRTGRPGTLRGPAVTGLDLHVPVPGSGAYLLLPFSTPLTPLAGALVGMSDAIAATLRCTP